MEQANLMKVLTYVADQTMTLAKDTSVLGERIEQDGPSEEQGEE